jgi:GNAT superfamily N-acetyltransferase
MHFIGPSTSVAAHCERILRSVPQWFGIEESLLEYVADSQRYVTFLAIDEEPIAFVTVREHFAQSWEVHCVAVHASRRNSGVGMALHGHVESWLKAKGVSVLQVKTLSASHPSPEYAQTRGFYERMGYLPLEEFPTLWDPDLPALQLVK